jgi:transposase-like protein
MNIIKFVETFPDELSCRSHFKEKRELEGITCKRCNGLKHWWLKSKEQWKCAECGFRTTLRSGTIMESSNLPLYKWYLAMAFMSFSKKGLSACELQRQMGHKNYDTVWSLMHRIRQAMGERDALYKLEDMSEFDETYVVTATPEKVRNNLKRGKGSRRVNAVAVAAESIPLENIATGEQSRQCRYFKMKKLEGQSSADVEGFIEENMDSKSVVFTDKSLTYNQFSDYVDAHITIKSDKKATQKTLKWVHIAIANLKRNLLGIYHRVNEEYLQNYLHEFCYKLNRRYFGDQLFDRVVVAVIAN